MWSAGMFPKSNTALKNESEIIIIFSLKDK